MRILNIRFKNLNSLVGEWNIDLTLPAYTSDGIFAITGPTGAGKTTILDAVCLALYGRTPRLSRVTKSGNEIMSRQTGECFAEVTFEAQTGRFRCHWSQHRSRKKASGELQSPKHEISNADTGEIFETRLLGVAKQIEAATGMDFDRFTRSMLLAQGGFAVFLQAAADERAPILEQITGTEIYSQISIRVHERQREERETLNLLQAETAGIVILTPEEEDELHHTLAARTQDESVCAAGAAEARKAVVWLAAVDDLNRQINGLHAEADRLRGDVDAFRPDRERLERALAAAALDGAYATLAAIRQQQTEDGSALKAAMENLPGLVTAAAGREASLISAGQRTAAAKDELRGAAAVMQKVRSLDQKCADRQQAVREGEEACRRDSERIGTDRAAQSLEQKKYADARALLEETDCYLREHAGDEWLVSGLAGVAEQLDGLVSRHRDMAALESVRVKQAAAVKSADNVLAACRQQCQARRQALTEVEGRLLHSRAGSAQLLGDRMLREYRAEKEALLREQAFLAKIAELEDHRAALEDGKPCPLCGSAEHPYAAGNVPAPDENEQKIEALARLISAAEEMEAAIKTLEEAVDGAVRSLAESDKKEAAAASERTAAGTFLQETGERLVQLQSDVAERRQALTARLLPLGITEITGVDPLSLLETLTLRLKGWQSRISEKAEIEKRIAGFEGELKRLAAVIEAQSRSLAEKQERLEGVRRELSDLAAERLELYGDKNPDAEEARLLKAVSDAEDAEKTAGKLCADAQQQLLAERSRCESLDLRIRQRAPGLDRLEQEFCAALVPLGLAGEAGFLGIRLDAGRRESLSVQARTLDDRSTDLNSRLKDRSERLEAELAKQVTEKSLAELEALILGYDESLQNLRDTIAAIKHRLNENAAARERTASRQAAIEAQKTECRRWETLHSLIGSADGKKYRNFAQGLTFEIMVGHANRQLQKMTDRYLLIRDSSQPLELNVVDNFQAGETRSTKNLSGGESFIVSLSLALGLAHMAGRNVRVDSLFLDEGFGTLDEEALDTALETLAGLQEDGKLIGVISHVTALKERISTRIQVTPASGGKSVISGPGCTATAQISV